MHIASVTRIPEFNPAQLLLILSTECAVAAPQHSTTPSIQQIRVLSRDGKGRLHRVETKLKRFGLDCCTKSEFSFPAPGDTVHGDHTTVISIPVIG
eukprot:75796-Rhodomonas_salina.1